MEKNKKTFITYNKYDTQVYYEDLITRYNPNNTLIKDIEAGSNEQFIGEVLEMVSRLIYEPVINIEDVYKEEIDLYWESQGKYLVQCMIYDLLSDVVISIEKI